MLPSIPKVIYAVATNTSIGALFVAGLLPGIMLTTMLCVVTWWIARKNNYPRMPQATWGQRWRAFRESIWGLMLVVIIIGGIYSGIFTATEAAAMSAVYAFFVSVFVYKAHADQGHAEGAARLGEHERDAALHHHQRGACSRSS